VAGIDGDGLLSKRVLGELGFLGDGLMELLEACFFLAGKEDGGGVFFPMITVPVGVDAEVTFVENEKVVFAVKVLG